MSSSPSFLANFKKSAKRTLNNMRATFALAYSFDKKLIISYFVVGFIVALTPLAAAFVFKVLIDFILQYGEIANSDLKIPLVVILAVVAYSVIETVNSIVYGLSYSYYDYLIRYKFQIRLDHLLASKVSSLDLEYLEDPEINNLITKVTRSALTDIPEFIQNLQFVTRDLVSIIATGIVLFPYGFWIPLVLILALIPRLYLKGKNSNFLWSMYSSTAPEAKQMNYLGYLMTQAPAILESRVLQSRPHLLDKLAYCQNSLFSSMRNPIDKYKNVVILASLFEGIIALGIIILLIPDALTGAISIGTITFLITTVERYRYDLYWIANSIGDLYQKKFFVEPFFELMNLPSLVVEKEEAEAVEQELPASIEFRNVSFSYPNGRSVLKDVSFTITPGESVALVGVNGAGKTTLIKLLCRFYDVTSGEILINGTNIKDVKLSDWYAQIGTLFQDFVHYNLTVRDNILLGAPDVVDEKRMEDAAIRSGAYEFIDKFPKKYDQMLGREFEDGEGLSGGQWQKLAIARALYEQSKILIMDEPTSAIDAEAEYEIFQNLEKIYKDRTLILVSHRFSTVRNANKIIVLDDGKIIEMGSHDELLSVNGKYAKMFNTQAKGYV